MFDRGLQRDLDRYRANLKRKEIEHQIKYSLIHERKAEVIANVYAGLVKAKRKMAQLVFIFQPDGQNLQKKKQDAADACNNVDDYFNEHRLYLDRVTADKAESILIKMKEAFINFDTAQNGDDYKPDATGFWRQANDQIKNEIPPLLEELESEFRTILGIHGENKP
ncbi:MAG: hypothetical protein GXO85_15035 [Chlorobi bacterium]|nr:hypothetical protein [Chlorobiota bacterium]